MPVPTLKVQNVDRALNVRPDPLDFRDKMYEATLIYVPPKRDLGAYLDAYARREQKLEILNQHSEGACTGFALAAVANYLLRTTEVAPPANAVKNPFAGVSERMLYEMAKRYDDRPGEEYSGSSARGAMKGWHKHGVCTSNRWEYIPGKADAVLSTDRAVEARERPLGAYFRVNHRDLVAMHAAITEVGILYAGARVHKGWQKVKSDGIIPREEGFIGGHAFAIVAYDDTGFWMQNSWGPDWGRQGFGKISYDDWLENGLDIWVARLGVPVTLQNRESIAILQSSGALSSPSEQNHELRPHIISIGNDGLLRDNGAFGTNEKEVESIIHEDVRQTLESWKKDKKKPRLLLYAHGGLTSETSAVQRVAEYRPTLLQHGIYPLSFVWKTDYFTTVSNILRDAFEQRKPEGVLDSAKDFMLDRADDALEPFARRLTGKAVWTEMKENAVRATTIKNGGARKVAFELFKLLQNPKLQDTEIHVIGHSAGSVFLGPLLNLLASKAGAAKIGANGFGIPIKSCTLWAPACTIEFFKKYYGPVMSQIDNFAIFTLTDKVERDDHCAHMYNKSLLYLVSHAFEETPHVPLFSEGEPILGMEKWIAKVAKKDAVFKEMMKNVAHVRSPNTRSPATGLGSAAAHHGDFDNDDATVRSTLARMLGPVSAGAIAGTKLNLTASSSNRRDLRKNYERVFA